MNVWILILAASAPPQEPEPDLPRLVLKISRTSALAFEPVFCTVRLENPKTVPLRVELPTFGWEADTELEGRRAGEPWRPVGIGAVIRCGLGLSAELGPGGAIVDVLPLMFYDILDPSRNRIEDRAGRWTFRARHPIRYEPHPAYLTSNEVALEIGAPSTPDDRAALELLQDPEPWKVYHFLDRGDDEATRRGVQKLADLVRLYPTSAYSSWAAYAVGEHHATGRRMPVQQGIERFPDGTPIPRVVLRPDPQRYASAQAAFRVVVAQGKDAGLKARAHLSLAELAVELENRVEGLSHLEEADRLDEDGALSTRRRDVRFAARR